MFYRQSCTSRLLIFTLTQGFFAVYRNLFNRLQAEEAMFSDIDLPSFGYSTWTWTPVQKGEDLPAARTFYNVWINFVTNKDFTWCDQWNLAEAPDRRVRRYLYFYVYAFRVLSKHIIF